MQSIKLIAGLGNPSRTYEQTRHNIGFHVVDLVAARYCNSAWKTWQSPMASLSEYLLDDARAYLLKVVSGSGDDPSLAQTFFDSFRVAP